MKTASLTYPTYRFIDLAPLAARYEVLTQAVLAYLAAGQMREVLRYTHKITRLIRVYARLDTQNRLWARKLEMLSNKNWRERVLRDLGGMRKLKLWEAAHEKVSARSGEPAYASDNTEPSWLFTPERMAESERLKAHARKCLRAGAKAQPNVFRDRVRMDFYGEFCLPPLPRFRVKGQQVKVYTQNSISDYQFNAMSFGQEEGFGPATVWPVEFYAAAEVEVSNSVIPALRLPSQTLKPGPNTEDCTLLLGPGSHCISRSKIQKVRDDRREGMPLHLSLDPKTYRDIFENPV